MFERGGEGGEREKRRGAVTEGVSAANTKTPGRVGGEDGKGEVKRENLPRY